MSSPPNPMSSQTTPVSPNRCVGSSKEPCPRTHWIAVKLVRLPLWAQKVPLDDERNPYKFPRETGVTPGWIEAGRPYASEPFSAQLPDGPRNGKLDGKGSVRFNNIPEGQAEFKFDTFYRSIYEYCIKELM